MSRMQEGDFVSKMSAVCIGYLNTDSSVVLEVVDFYFQ